MAGISNLSTWTVKLYTFLIVINNQIYKVTSKPRKRFSFKYWTKFSSMGTSIPQKDTFAEFSWHHQVMSSTSDIINMMTESYRRDFHSFSHGRWLENWTLVEWKAKWWHHNWNNWSLTTTINYYKCKYYKHSFYKGN